MKTRPSKWALAVPSAVASLDFQIVPKANPTGIVAFEARPCEDPTVREAATAAIAFNAWLFEYERQCVFMAASTLAYARAMVATSAAGDPDHLLPDMFDGYRRRLSNALTDYLRIEDPRRLHELVGPRSLLRSSSAAGSEGPSMTLIDLAERATFAGGMVMIPVAKLPTGERINIKTTGAVIAYYSEGSMSVEAVEELRGFLIAMAQNIIEQDASALRPSPQPGAPPWVLIDHEALELS